MAAEELQLLARDVQAAGAQGQEVTDTWVRTQYERMARLAGRADLVTHLVCVLESLHALGAPPPPPACLHALDGALLSCLTSAGGGVHAWRGAGTAHSTWSLTPAQCTLILQLALSAPNSQGCPQPINRGTGAVEDATRANTGLLIFPLLCEAALLKAGASESDALVFAAQHPPSTSSELSEALDEYHTAVNSHALLEGREGAPAAGLLPPGFSHLKGRAACELQVPLLRRHRHHLSFEELVVVIENMLEAEKEGERHELPNAFQWDLTAQLECALQELHARMHHQLQGMHSRRMAPGSLVALTQCPPARAWQVSKRVLWVVLLQYNQHKHLMEPSLAQHALACARASIELAEVEGDAVLADVHQWLDGTVPGLLDALCAEQVHPAILTDGVVLLSRAPSLNLTWRTPGALVARLTQHLPFFSHAQLCDALRALGRFTAAHEAAHAGTSHNGAGGSAHRSGLAAGSTASHQQVVSVPLEVLLPDYVLGHDSGTQPGEDLLARIGHRLGRDLLTQPAAMRGRMLRGLGLLE